MEPTGMEPTSAAPISRPVARHLEIEALMSAGQTRTGGPG